MIARRNGKIARLPEAVRTHVNQMIHDGVHYDKIIAWLGTQGHPGIIKMNLSRWAQGGYQDWLDERHAVKQDRERYDWALEMAEKHSDRTITRAVRQLNSLQFFDATNRMDTVELSKMLERRPEKYITLLNTFLKYIKQT